MCSWAVTSSNVFGRLYTYMVYVSDGQRADSNCCNTHYFSIHGCCCRRWSSAGFCFAFEPEGPELALPAATAAARALLLKKFVAIVMLAGRVVVVVVVVVDDVLRRTRLSFFFT